MRLSVYLIEGAVNSYNKVQSRVTHKITVEQEVKKEKSITPYQIDSCVESGEAGPFCCVQ